MVNLGLYFYQLLTKHFNGWYNLGMNETKRPEGRPPKWNSVEELENLIKAYFISIQDEEGEYKRPPTVTGLALFLGTNRQTIINYEEKSEYFDAIKEAKTRCEQWVEESALTNKANATFSIFNLKNNYGWKERNETDITTGGKPLILPSELIKKNGINTEPENNSQQ